MQTFFMASIKYTKHEIPFMSFAGATVVWWPSEQVPGHTPDTCQPRTSTAHCTSSVTAIRVSTSTTASHLMYPPSPSSSRYDPLMLDPIPSVARTDASDNGASNVTLRLAPGRETSWCAAAFWHGLVGAYRPVDRRTEFMVGWEHVSFFSLAVSLRGNVGEMRTNWLST